MAWTFGRKKEATHINCYFLMIHLLIWNSYRDFFWRNFHEKDLNWMKIWFNLLMSFLALKVRRLTKNPMFERFNVDGTIFSSSRLSGHKCHRFFGWLLLSVGHVAIEKCVEKHSRLVREFVDLGVKKTLKRIPNPHFIGFQQKNRDEIEILISKSIPISFHPHEVQS